MRQTSKSVAMVMPEIGFDELPTSPVRRLDTVTKRKPKSRIIAAPSKPLEIQAEAQLRDGGEDEHEAEAAPQDDGHRHVALGRGTARPAPVAAARGWRAGRAGPPTIEPKMSGSARNMLMMPPAATAPAPM